MANMNRGIWIAFYEVVVMTMMAHLEYDSVFWKNK